MNFGEAIEAAKAGQLVARSGWNGKNMFVFMRPADELDIDMIVHKVKSLPASVKAYYASQTNPNLTDRVDDTSKIRFTAYLCMKNAQGEIMNGWAATQTDMLAEDWTVLAAESK
jgi:hypothetical protein